MEAHEVAASNGAVINQSVLYFQSASITYPGLVNTTTQSFTGAKTFESPLTIGQTSITDNSTAPYNFNLPANGETAGYFLQSTGGGTMTWAAQPTGSTPSGTNWGDYLYWDNITNSYAVGDTNITLGKNAGQYWSRC